MVSCTEEDFVQVCLKSSHVPAMFQRQGVKEIAVDATRIIWDLNILP